MKKILILLAVLTLMQLFIFLKNDTYQVKISFKIENLDVEYIDINFANNLKKELLKNNDIKEVVSFSNQFGFNLYCKIKLFKLNKTINYIKETAYNFKNQNQNTIKKITFDEKYNLKYTHIILIKDKDYFTLNYKTNELFEKILASKTFNKVDIFGKQQLANYIYFQNKDLINYNINLEDIAKIIKENNLFSTNIIGESSFYQNSHYDTKIQSIKNLKELLIKYQDDNFTNSFSNIFEIKKEIKTPAKGYIFKNDDFATVIALRKNKLFPSYLINSTLEEFNAEIIKISKLKKIEIYLNKNRSIDECIKLHKKIIQNLNINAIYFVSLNPLFYKFSENCDYRIIVLLDKKDKRKLINFLSKEEIDYHSNKNEKISTCTTSIMQTKYTFNNNEIQKNHLTKSIIHNSILARNEGLKIGEYKNNEEEIEIILKNKNKENFIYSKKHKTLLSAETFLKETLKEDFKIIKRKNFAVVY